LSEVFTWICKQFQDASSVIEYVSWLTASIFSVLAVFTIFLAHQFQSHTSELIKVTWRLRESSKSLKNEESHEEFSQLLHDFEYFSKSPAVLQQAIIISKVVLRILIPIWFVSALSISSEVGMESQSSFPLVSVLMIVAITGLFIYFSFMLLDILDRLTKEGNDDVAIKTLQDFKDVANLKESGFNMENIFKLEQLRFEILLNDEEPLASTRVVRKHGFYNFYILLSIDCNRKLINIGSRVNDINNEIRLYISGTEQEKINQFFEDNNIGTAKAYITLFTEERSLSFKADSNFSNEDGDFPLEVQFSIGERIDYTPPRNIVSELKKENRITSIGL
jgi:hypothetical protein